MESKQTKIPELEAEASALQSEIDGLKQTGFFDASGKTEQAIQDREARRKDILANIQKIKDNEQTERERTDAQKRAEAEKLLKRVIPKQAKSYLQSEQKAFEKMWGAYLELRSQLIALHETESNVAEHQTNYFSSLRKLGEIHPELPQTVDELRRSPIVRAMEKEAARDLDAWRIDHRRRFRRELMAVWVSWQKYLDPKKQHPLPEELYH